MSGNAITISPLLPITQPLEAIQLAPTSVENVSLKFVPSNIGLIAAYNSIGNQIYIQSEPLTIQKPVDVIVEQNLPIVTANNQQFIQHKANGLFIENIQQINTNGSCNQIVNVPEKKNEDMVVYQITYPEDLNLKAVKRGRTKNKIQDKPENAVKEKKQPPAKAPRTRSGRIIKTPKHIEKDFEKILITNEPEVKTAKFINIKEEKEEKKDLKELEFHFKKKTISAQFRCTFCKKAYLGKRAMYQHLLKNPDHGPLPDKNNNFDVWNYLVDITQKCPSGRRGVKFCEELTNLLHNLQLLTSALFKNFKANVSEKNAVQVDKVLGNAIGLQPGKYNFDENELYKDVTVLKLITNSQFFAPKKTVNEGPAEIKTCNNNVDASKNTNVNNNNIESIVNVAKIVLPLANEKEDKLKMNGISFHGELTSANNCETSKSTDVNNYTNVHQTFNQNCAGSLEASIENINKATEVANFTTSESHSENFTKEFSSSEAVPSTIKNDNKTLNFNENSINKAIAFPPILLETAFTNTSPSPKQKPDPELPKTDIELKMVQNSCIDTFTKAIENQAIDGGFKKIDDHTLSLHSDLLSDNSLLTLPNLRTSVEDLIMSNVDASSSLLDNSTSSDEVMNVDQFVNERFKKITEPDMELFKKTPEPESDLKFNTSLNLDLPSLELFQFHTS